MKTAVLAGGCYWCTEAIFREVKGVTNVISGFAYPDVRQSNQSHKGEAVYLNYDPNIVSYEDLLHIFFGTHDPTTLNQQGNDIGPEYRSAIFYQDDEQRKIATEVIQNLENQKLFEKPIVTEVTPLKKFDPAPPIHQNYYQKFSDEPYCKLVISPKLAKFREKYAHFLKS